MKSEKNDLTAAETCWILNEEGQQFLTANTSPYFEEKRSE